MKKIIIPVLAVTILFSCTNNNPAETKTTTDSTQTVAKDTSTATSIFNLQDTFQTQQGKNFILSDLKGKPTVVAMIFTNCSYACPRITSDMKGIEEKLKTNKDKVNFLMVSFDTERDTPAQLKKFQDRMELGSNWILLHANDQTVRTLSVLLNVQYAKDAEGNFSHSNLITVLDKNGVLKFQKEGLEADHTETIEKINQLIN